MKNRTYVIAVAMLCAAMFTGCSGDKDTTNSIDATTSTVSTLTTTSTSATDITDADISEKESAETVSDTAESTVENIVELEEPVDFAFYEETDDGSIIVSMRNADGISKMIYIFDENKILKDAVVQLVPGDGTSFDEMYEISGVTVEKDLFVQVSDNSYEAPVNIMNDIPLEYHNYAALLEYVRTSVEVYNAFAGVDDIDAGNGVSSETSITEQFGEYNAVIKSDINDRNELSLRVDLSKVFDEVVENTDAIETPVVNFSGARESDPDVKTDLSMDVYSIFNVDNTVTWYYNYTFAEGETYDTITIFIDDIDMTFSWSDIFG